MRIFLENRSARLLSFSYMLSKVGEFAFEAAFAVALIKLLEANFWMLGVVYFFRYLPSLIFSPIGGWLADNASAKKTLRSIETLRVLVAAGFFIALQSPNALVFLVILSMALTALDCMYVPTFRACMPKLVKRDDLTSANSGIQVIEDASSIIGPLVFSFFVLVGMSEQAFLAFSAFALAATCALAFLPDISAATGKAFDIREVSSSLLRDVHALRNDSKAIFGVIACTTVCAMCATSLIRFILPASILANFENEAVVGYLLSLLALGTVVGGLAFTSFFKEISPSLVFKAWFFYGLVFLCAAVAVGFSKPVFVMLILMIGFAGAIVDIAIVTNLQLLSDELKVGRNFSIYYFSAVFGDALSGIIAGLIFSVAGPVTFIAMTTMLAVAPVKWITWRRQ